MKIRNRILLLFAGVGILTFTLATSLQAATTTIVDDSFSDGDFAKTGALDTPWWTSSSSSGKEITPGTLGLVTGTSGRGIHTIFPTQTISNVGDSLKATYTFTTPTTIDASGGNDASLRIGLFNDLGRADLNADVSASSGTPNELYGWGTFAGGPGTEALPGYMHDLDVYAAGDANATGADLNFREHTTGTLNGTGRLMSTTTNFANISPSGPDAGYTWASNSEYTGSVTITRISATDFNLTATLDVPGGVAGVPEHSYTVADAFDSDSFNMLAFHTNSNKFGSSNSAGEPDNGLDFSNIKIEFTPIPEPSTIALLLGACLAIPYKARRRR